MDNFFTDFSLVEDLLKETIFLINIIRKNGKNLSKYKYLQS